MIYMKDEKRKKLGDLLEDIAKGRPTEIHAGMQLRDEAVEIILDGLTDGFVKAFHGFGRRALAQVHVSKIDCGDCGALLSFNIICPVDDFHFILKDTLKRKDFQANLNEKIKLGRDFNDSKGFKIQRASERIAENKPKGHNIRVD